MQGLTLAEVFNLLKNAPDTDYFWKRCCETDILFRDDFLSFTREKAFELKGSCAQFGKFWSRLGVVEGDDDMEEAF